MNVLKHLVFRSWLPLAGLILVLVSQVWADTPRCPQGYKLNADGSKCVKDVTPTTCPTGSAWSSGACRTMVSANCVPGANYHSPLRKCESFIEPPTTISCPSGYTYFSSNKKCRKLQDPNCPSGFHWNDPLRKCESFIEPPTTISCPSGYTYFSSNKKCRKLQDPNCPSGFHWNMQNEKCVITGGTAAPACPPGSSYNADKKICEESVTPYCAAGYRLYKGQCTRGTGTYQ